MKLQVSHAHTLPGTSPVAAAVAIARRRLRALQGQVVSVDGGGETSQMTIEQLRARLQAAWSRDTSGAPEAWTPDRPSTGQCSVSSLVTHRLIGGEIFWTAVDGEAHFYNVVDGALLDLTADQFDDAVTYTRNRADAGELLADDDRRARFERLLSRVTA